MGDDRTDKNQRRHNKWHLLLASDRFYNPVCVNTSLCLKKTVHRRNQNAADRQKKQQPPVFKPQIGYKINAFMKQTAKSLFAVICGNFLYALTVKLFLLPGNLVTGGTTGIALTINHFLPIPIPALFWPSTS